MAIEFNANVNLINGGTFRGNSGWNKSFSSIDNCFKLYYIQSGRIAITKNEKTTELESSRLYFINGYKLESQKCIKPFVVDWIHFMPKSLYLSFILKTAPCVSELHVNEFTSFMPYLTTLEDFFNRKSDKAEYRTMLLEIQALIYFTIAKIYRMVNPSDTYCTEELQRLHPALDYISENFTKRISLKNLADLCCLSPNYFHRVFTCVFNVSPLNYIRNLRLDEAVRQLVYSSNSVKLIAYSIGYDDEAYFSRVFSKVYGMSPGVYRKQSKKNMP